LGSSSKESYRSNTRASKKEKETGQIQAAALARLFKNKYFQILSLSMFKAELSDSANTYDAQFQEALAAALFAENLNGSRKRSHRSKNNAKNTNFSPPSKRQQGMGGFGCVSPTADPKKNLGVAKMKHLRSRIAGKILALKETRQEVLRRRTVRMKTNGPVEGIVDELAHIRKLRGEERVAAFLKVYDPAIVDQANRIVNYGGRSEVEMWNDLQIKYHTNQRKRLHIALKLTSSSRSEPWHCNVDTYLDACNDEDEVEELIAKYTNRAMAKLKKKQDKIDRREMTWHKGQQNSYQNAPSFELDD
jgi:hypothetical protein